MPLYDTTIKAVFKDPKPERICQYSKCPNEHSYKGLKVKLCARCHWVRYCVSRSEQLRAHHAKTLFARRQFYLEQRMPIRGLEGAQSRLSPAENGRHWYLVKGASLRP